MTSYIVPSDKEPTAWNKSTAVGAIGGFYVGGPLGAGIGAIIGGQYGKNEMAREQENGHLVTEPTAWNKDSIIGGFLGNVGGSLLAAGVLAVAVLAIGTPTALTLGMVAAGAAIIGGTTLGAMWGGKRGKEHMAEEYAEAEQLALQGKAKAVGAMDFNKEPAAKEPTIEHNAPELRTDHAARIREQQAAAQAATGRGA